MQLLATMRAVRAQEPLDNQFGWLGLESIQISFHKIHSHMRQHIPGTARPLFFPFNPQQPRGRKKPNATITPPQDSYDAAHFHPDAGKLWPKSILINCYSSTPSSSSGAATGHGRL
jgi:hypothetical protein